MSGQLGYREVKNANLGPLGEAVAKWRLAPGNFQQIQLNLYNEVTRGLDSEHWRGEAAQAALGKFQWIQKQLAAALEEALHVYNVMHEGLQQFTSAKKALEAIETELEGHKYLRLNKADGSVYLHLTAEEEHNRAALTKAYQDTFHEYRTRTSRAIEQAAQADTALAEALTTDANGEDRGFNAKAYDSLDEARRGTEKDLEQALDLASIGNGKMTSDQLAKLSALMARHSEVPDFAEKFATGLGPEKTLQLWFNATHPRNANRPGTAIDEKVWWKSAERLQKSLGTTLATASHSDSPAMKAWQDEMIRRGPERLDSGGTTHPYGFQIMSNLMRTGTYDKSFLNSYGDKLIDWDRKNNTKKGLPYWSNTADADMLNLIGGRNDHGHDPVTGFLEGLGHSPAAATEFFKKPGGGAALNDHLSYLAEHRNWTFDGLPGGAPRNLPGHQALGHALTAATTGYAWDAPELTGENPELFAHGGDRRTAATAHVMEQVVRLYGGDHGPRLLHDQPGMADSLGRMGGAYVDDLNWSMSGLGDNTKLRNGVAFPGVLGEHDRAGFGRGGSINFLSVLGQNEDSHALMNQAEHLYTMDRFAQNPLAGGKHHVENAVQAIVTEAEVRGILDHSRAAQIEATYRHDVAAAQEAYRDSTSWTRVGMSGGMPAVGQGIVQIVGKSGPWGLLVPVAMGGTTEFLKQFHDDVLFSGPHLPPPVDSGQFFQRGEDELGNTAAQHDLQRYEGAITERLKNAYYGSGATTDTYRGHKPYTP